MTLARVTVPSILTLLLLAGPALGQSADRPTVKVGDRWQFVLYWATPSKEPNRTWVITSVGAGGIEGTEDGQPLRLTADLNILDSPQQTESNPQALTFPLEVGRRWRYASDWLFKPKGSRGRADVEVTVAAPERVTVPAGQFDAFKLVARSALRGISGINSQIDAETVRTYWYAPAARAIVKSINRNPYLGTSTVELVTFELQP